MGCRFIIDDVVCGLHVRNGVAVPTAGASPDSTVTMSQKTLHALLKGSVLWSDMVAESSVLMSGDADAVNGFRKSLENKGFSS